MAKKNGAAGGTPTITNRKAYHDYSISDELEVGIVLRGMEVKSIRAGAFLIGDAYVDITKDGELWLVGGSIAPYKHAGTHEVYEPERRRKLLAHREEIAKLRKKRIEKGFTIVPLKAYFKDGKVKLLIGLAKGKKEFDKRETIKTRDVQRDMDRSGARKG
ncbi:MAG: SsrA-binding protein SmpB [bacterium]|nr:SsrA-binding protein SmpB [bacterium]